MNDIAQFDVVVYGATPGGIAAAISAAREGCRTALMTPGNHVGGMSSSGLCTTDAVRREAFGGIIREFVGRVREDYSSRHGADSEAFRLCRDGWWYEPHVADRVFREMIRDEEGLHLLTDHEISEAVVADRRIEAVLSGGRRFEAHTFIDASYEGDLAAVAGVPCRVSREGRSEFDEPLAGVVYFDWKRGIELPESTGQTHPDIQSYCFRHTLTDDPKNQVIVEKPESYDDLLPDFLPLLSDIQSGRVRSMEDVTMTNRLPNRKLDANGQIEGLTSFNLPGGNRHYSDGSRTVRERIITHHRLHAHGLLYFAQNDPRVSPAIRDEMKRWHFCMDEYPENAHQPPQLYIRQSRRIKGRTLLTEHDFRVIPGTRSTPRHRDAIAVAEHSFDIHPCQNRSFAKDGWMEGVLWYPDKANGPAQPGQIPYGAILPETLDNLLVPVALSATHIAFSVVRMEPVWMATGQAAGLAAAIAGPDIPVAKIEVSELQSALRERNQVIDLSARA